MVKRKSDQLKEENARIHKKTIEINQAIARKKRERKEAQS